MRDFFEILRNNDLYNESYHNRSNHEYYLNGNLVGGMILYVYQNTCTYAFSVASQEHNHLSVGHALIWQAILFTKEQDLDLLDFEGSMIPQIERVFRRFGSVPVDYLNFQYAKFSFLYRS